MYRARLRDPAKGCTHVPQEGDCGDGDHCTEGHRCEEAGARAGIPVRAACRNGTPGTPAPPPDEEAGEDAAEPAMTEEVPEPSETVPEEAGTDKGPDRIEPGGIPDQASPEEQPGSADAPESSVSLDATRPDPSRPAGAAGDPTSRGTRPPAGDDGIDAQAGLASRRGRRRDGTVARSALDPDRRPRGRHAPPRAEAAHDLGVACRYQRLVGRRARFDHPVGYVVVVQPVAGVHGRLDPEPPGIVRLEHVTGQAEPLDHDVVYPVATGLHPVERLEVLGRRA